MNDVRVRFRVCACVSPHAGMFRMLRLMIPVRVGIERKDAERQVCEAYERVGRV